MEPEATQAAPEANTEALVVTGKAKKAKGAKPAPKKAAPKKAAPKKAAPVAVPDALRTSRRVAEKLKMLGDATRLLILQCISENGGTNVQDIVKYVSERGLASSQPAVSHHLAILRASATVEAARDGKFSCYNLTEDGQQMAAFVAALSSPA